LPAPPERATHGWRATAVAIAAAGLLALSGSPALASAVTCGSRITASTTLRSDLVNCPLDGLLIDADNMTLNLNGHTIDGDAGPVPEGSLDAGIRLLTPHHGVTITGGTVREFDRGIQLEGASDNQIVHMLVRANGNSGIQIGSDGASSDRNRIVDNTVASNGQAGIGLFESDHNVIRRDTVSNNGGAGAIGIAADHSRIAENVFVGNEEGVVLIEGSDDNEIDANSIADSTFEAMEIDFSDRTSISRNRAARNEEGIIILGNNYSSVTLNVIADSGEGCTEGCGGGVAIDGGSHNLAAANLISHNAGTGIRLAAFEPDTPPAVDNTLRDNLVLRSGHDGIAVAAEGFGTVTGSVMERNSAIGSGADGINVQSAATTLTRNLGLRNGDFGIEAVIGVTDGGGNHAFGNGNPLQCINISC
jgi:parallel beta-helix repeat protein